MSIHFFSNLKSLKKLMVLLLMTSATVLRAQQSNQSLSINLPTTENTNRSFVPKGKLTLAVYGRQVEDAFLKNKQGVSVINPEFEASYNDYLTLALEFAALIGTGNTSNFWSEEGKAPSSILLTEAFAKVNFHENVFFRVGALETTINPISSIMSSMTFLGAQEEWAKLELKNLILHLVLISRFLRQEVSLRICMMMVQRLISFLRQ